MPVSDLEPIPSFHQRYAKWKERHLIMQLFEAGLLYSVIVVIELNVPRTKSIAPHKFLIPWRTLVLGVACQHALNAHTDALHVLYWTPTLLTKKIETNKAVGIYVRVHRNRSVRQLDEGNLRWF